MLDLRAPAPEDAAAVSRICFETGPTAADPGASPELVATVWADPYLAFAPEWCRVAVDEVGVAGYLLAVPSTAAFESWAAREWWPRRRAEHPVDPASSEADRRIAALLVTPPSSPTDIAAAYPAHLHIDFLPRLRGRGVARRMIDDLCDRLGAAGVAGVHLGVGTGNANANGFYRHLGFAELRRDDSTIWMGRSTLPSTGPALLAIAHGTDSPTGRGAIGALVAAIRERVPDTHAGFVDVQHPEPATVLGGLPTGRPAVLVPLLLSAGYHVRIDLARAARHADRPVTVAGALGPDDGLVRLLARRLAAAGLRDDDAVVLAAAGSSDAAAVADCAETARRLAALLGRPVTVGYLSAATPPLQEAVAAARRGAPRVAVATYLLAPGFFAAKAAACGADVVAAPLLDGGEVPAELLDAALDRYAAAR